MAREKKTVDIPATFAPRFWDAVDGRLQLAKEINRRLDDIIVATGAADSPQKKMLCQRAVFLNMMLETMEREGADSGNFNTAVYTQGTNALIGVLRALGLNRQAVQSIDLKTYLQDKKAAP